jgi:cyclic pyranopterin phosphate synthase
MIEDSFGRVHDYLRISLTDNCNFRCFYCMPEEDFDFTPASRLMQPEEVLAVAKVFVAQGVKKIRLTGGEPLVRKDAALIISELGKLHVELVITTNVTRIAELLPILISAGLKLLMLVWILYSGKNFYLLPDVMHLSRYWKI